MLVKSVTARQFLDSRGNPTVQAELSTAKGVFSAIVPSGASTGKYEALEMRDKGREFMGKSVHNAVSNVTGVIAKEIEGKEFPSFRGFDNALIALDGTGNKGKLGANAILSVSMSACRAFSAEREKPLYQYLAGEYGNSKLILPLPQMNVINGGKHAGMDNDIQEHMIAPVGSKNYSDALRACVESYHTLKAMLKKKFGARAAALGDEGGFVPPIETSHDRLEAILKAVGEAGYSKEMKLAIDSAASEFFKDGKYTLGGKQYTSGEMVDFYKDMLKTFPIYSLEDAMSEDDWEGWSLLAKELGKKVQIVADDLTVTNPNRIKRALEHGAANALLLKVNQIGTVSESFDAAKLSADNGWGVVVSHRSGETEDDFIADLVVGLGKGQSKFGAPARGERNAKYNRLLRIEEELGSKAAYAGSLFKK